MPIPNSFKPIVERLQRGTADRLLSWQEMPNDAGFYVALQGVSIAINIYRGVLITLKVLDERADPLDSFSLAQQDPDFRVLADLYEQARRQSRRLDERLAAVVNELDRKLSGNSK